MSSFASFSKFIRHGGQASIILRLRPVEPLLELKQSSPGNPPESKGLHR